MSAKDIPAVTHSDGIPLAVPTPVEEHPGSSLPPSVKCLPAEFYNDFLSDYGRSQMPNPIRKVIPLSKIPGMLSMFGGLPTPDMFPIKSMTIDIATPSSSPSSPAVPEKITLEGKFMQDALQYGDVAGLTYFVSWLEELQSRSHGGRKAGAQEGWSLAVGGGSQDLITKALNCILNPGDSALVEAPVYGGVIPVLKSLNADVIEISTDQDGICVDALEATLRSWPKGKPYPKVLYTIPFGCNPTGASATLERRRQVLRLAKEFNFLILEDDPYFYIYYGPSPKPPSYFELEATPDGGQEVGRVIRFDSLSKVLSAGMRIGFVSGPTPIVRAMNLVTSATHLQPNNLAQGVAYALLSHWGHDVFLQHTRAVAATYKRKRDLFAAAMNKHLGSTGLAEWEQPEAGMFFWFKLIGIPSGDSEDLILRRAVDQKVLALPGASFYAVERKSPYVRAAFSILPEEDFDEAMRRLAEIVRSVREEAKAVAP